VGPAAQRILWIGRGVKVQHVKAYATMSVEYGQEQAGRGIATEQKSGMKIIGSVVITLIISYS